VIIKIFARVPQEEAANLNERRGLKEIQFVDPQE
jgi:hypothetical protein